MNERSIWYFSKNVYLENIQFRFYLSFYGWKPFNKRGIEDVPLNRGQKGKGSLTVFASDLSNDIYTYTLVLMVKLLKRRRC
ncbi:MAG: hypothetical protein A3F72_19070 [Bacteroidetes bacterium RIFCSPLOWO2_12_FULL_35_15]|nr:MAG: hypothetical protein A3F72_19070 [Bacteroidetes bacterium RIFCSPLOWO2_12_FULL_35_15]